LILFLLPDFNGGGAQRVALNLIIGLNKRGYEVRVIIFNKKGPLLSELPASVIVYDLQTKTLRRSLFPLMRKIKLLNPKLVFSTFGYINIGLLFFRFIIPKEIKIWVREANLPSISLTQNPHRFIMKLGYRLLYKLADKVICSSQKMLNEFIENFKIPISKLEVIPNLVNVTMIQANISNATAYQNDKVNFVTMGRLNYQKGHDLLIKWFSTLKNKNSILRIIGSGPMEDELKVLVKKLNLSERVIFVGYIDKPWGMIAASDMFLLPSRWEGMPNAVLESLVCGTRVIATNESGGIIELSEISKNGAIIVTFSEIEFCTEMEKIKPNNTIKLKENLLPEIYYLENALEAFSSKL
jgi:glycosyltransferase involved in cell wall biosynthesis